MERTQSGSDGSAQGAGTAGGAAPGVRYRCTACGNLTRFDVVSTRRTQAYHHYALSGELVVEDEQVLAETVEEITCRWCGRGTAVERVAAGEPWGPSRSHGVGG